MGEETGTKSTWDIVDILLKPVGGLLTALAVALIGYLGSKFLNDQQTRETNVRVYTELMSRREAADTALRKDMFSSIIRSFIEPRAGHLEEDLLNLEMLAYNFHDSLDLGPLFKDVARRIDHRDPGSRVQLDRLEKVAQEVTAKQVGALEEGGAVASEIVDFEDLSDHPEGVTPIDEVLTMPSQDRLEEDTGVFRRRFKLEILDINQERKELRVRLRITGPAGETGEWEEESVFYLGFFDFPMIDNTRLSHSQRCAVLLRRFEDTSAQVTLVYFPGSRASLKEKPFYDEVMHELLLTHGMAQQNGR